MNNDKPKIDKGRWVQLYTDLFEMIVNEYHEGDYTSLSDSQQDDLRDLILNVMRDNLDNDFNQGVTEETEINVHD